MEEKLTERSYVKATIYTTTQGVEALAALLPPLEIDSYAVEDPADLEFIIHSKDKLAWDFVGLPPVSETEQNEVRVVFWLEEAYVDVADYADDVREKNETILQNVRIALMKLKSDEQYGLFGEGVDFGRLWLDTELENDNWKHRYKENFRTFSPVDGIVIIPPWEVHANAGDTKKTGAHPDTDVRIIIDPGMAFGTGSHETTSMCLAGLKERLKPGDLALDAGTGSGILAIAAALLGADHVDAVEVDADAAASAARNISANHAEEKISLIPGDLTSSDVLPSDRLFHVIIANLSSHLLIRLLPVFKRRLAENGVMILSGLLNTQEPEMTEALKRQGLRVFKVVRDGEWLMIETGI